MVISLLLFMLCIQKSINLPTNILDKRETNEDDADEKLSKDTKVNSSSEVITKTTPSTTIRSSIKPTKKRHTEDTKQPSSKAMPTVTPAKPIEHASNSPTPLHIQSVAPIKPMMSSHDDPVRLDPEQSEGRSDSENSDDDEAGCIDICHKTEIHPAAVPNDAIKQVLPSLPEMIAPLKNASYGDCCTWKCGKCNVTICKTSKPSCQGNNENPYQENNEKPCQENNEKPCQENNEKCAETSKPSCQENNEKCAQSLQTSNNAPVNPIIQKLTNCPMTCTHAQQPCTNNCPPAVTCSLNYPSYPSKNNVEYFPPCITNCNNNYLGNNLAYGGETRYYGDNNGGGNSFDAVKGRQPTTRKVSTIPPLASMKQFTETRAESGLYNPIQAMPTLPVLGPDDLIIHHILVAQQYITQNPSDYMPDGNLG